MMASVGGCACFLFRYALECVLALVSLALLGISLCFRLYCDVSASNAIPEEDLFSSSDSSSTATMMTCLSTPPLKALLRVVSLDDSIAERWVLVGMHVVLTTCFLAQVYHLFCRVVLLFPSREGAKSAVSLRQQTAMQSHHANRAVLCAVLLLLWHLFLLSWLIAAEVNTELSAWSQYQPCAEEVEGPPRQAHPSHGGCAVDQSVTTTQRGAVHEAREDEDNDDEQNDANCIAQRNGEVVWEGTTQRSVLRYQSSLLFDQWPPPLWAYVLETPQCSATRRQQLKEGDDDDNDDDREQTRKAMFRDDAEQTSLSKDFGSWLWGGMRRSDVVDGVVSESSTVNTGWGVPPAVQRRDAAVCGIRIAFVVALVTIFQSVALLTLL